MKKTINYSFKKFNTYNNKELSAASKVIKSGILSKYLAEKGSEFNGGYYVNKFEQMLSGYFRVKHAITVNSWTSGLVCAVGALDVNPGDEIIVTPWSMCASAICILHWNCIPVFVDIEHDTFCIDPSKIEKKINKKTKAILVADIFGQSSDILKILKIAKKHNLKVITDSAQAPGSKFGKKYTGTIADIGGFSLNYHKHIHTGEGGIILTNNDKLARRMRLIRNHAEVTIEKNENLSNMLGHNFRLGEIEASMGIEQLKKLKNILKDKISQANLLTNYLSKLPGIITPVVRKNCSHVYYVYAIKLNFEIIKFKREFILEKLVSEGVQGLSGGYTNLSDLNLFKKKIAYGKKSFPWSLNKKNYEYLSRDLKVCEELDKKSLISFEMCLFDLKHKDIRNIFKAFKKVWSDLKII
tara:strand:- start:488 stop:1723 length:1236 start_codon:yes stop_codon:yes gene_type:complete